MTNTLKNIKRIAITKDQRERLTCPNVDALSPPLLPPRWDARQIAQARAEVERLRARIADDTRWMCAMVEAIHFNEKQATNQP